MLDGRSLFRWNPLRFLNAASPEEADQGFSTCNNFRHHPGQLTAGKSSGQGDSRRPSSQGSSARWNKMCSRALHHPPVNDSPVPCRVFRRAMADRIPACTADGRDDLDRL